MKDIPMPTSRSIRSLWLAPFRTAPAAAKRRRPRRLFLEPLEDRTLLSVTIFGSVWNDLLADGVRNAEPGLSAVTVYLDDGSHAFNGSQPHTLTNGSGVYS